MTPASSHRHSEMPGRRREQELIQQTIGGNENAFAELYRHYYEPLCRYLQRFVPDPDQIHDVAQETFIRAREFLRQGRYREQGKFFEWLRRIAYNYYVDLYRKKKARRESRLSAFLEEDQNEDRIPLLADESEDSLPDYWLVRRERLRIVLRLLKKLPPEQRVVVEKRFFEGMTFRRISEETSVNINTTQGRLRYALRKLRRELPESLLEELLGQSVRTSRQRSGNSR